MAEVGSAYVSILPSARGFGSKLQSQVGPDVTKSGRDAGRRFGAAFKVGATVAAVAVGGFLKSAVSDASDFSESASKVGVVFGKSSKQIIKASKTSATAMGLSKNAYLEATGTLGNLLVSLDIAPEKAAGLSTEMVKLAGDLASFNNVSPEDALLALRAGLTGETEPLKRFGVNMNEATLKAQAMKMGLIKTTKDALNPQAKALAAQALIMEQTKTAQGDFARTSKGLANQQRILSAQFTDLKTTVGAALLPVITRLVTFANNNLIPAFTRLGPVFQKVKAFFAPLIDQFRSFFQGQGGNAIRVYAAKIAQSVLPVLKQLAETFKTRVLPALRLVADKFVEWLPTIQRVASFILSLLPPLIRLAGFLFSKIVPAVVAVIDVIVALINKLLDFIEAVKDVPDTIRSTFANAKDWLFDAGKALIQGLINGIDAMLGPVDEIIGKVAGIIGDHLPGSPIKRGPLKSWNNGGAGKRLIGFLADGLADTRPVETAMDRLSSKVSVATGRIGTPALALAGAGGQQLRGTLSIDRDGVAYIHGVSRREISGYDSVKRAADRAAALGGADFR